MSGLARRWSTPLLLTLACATLAAGCTSPPNPPADRSDVVSLDTGAVRGRVDPAGYREYAGIPYAAAPVGALRWHAPTAAASWDGVREATTPGAMCPQGASLAAPQAMTEDCLNLNVWTPAGSHTDLPVLVWIHGGSLISGAGSDYGPQKFLTGTEGPIVVVTINYRLGTLGFLADKSLEDTDGDVGNYGFQDQQFALKWVQRNIAAFGGDPAKVTIAGESSGSNSVCTHLAAPGSAGLFRAAIMQSGACLPWQTRHGAETAAATTATGLGCADPATTATCLRGLPVSAILAAQAQQTNGITGIPFLGTVGTPFMPRSPEQGLKDGALAHVPVITGTNHDESALFAWLIYGTPGAPTLTADRYPQALTEISQAHDFPLRDNHTAAVTAEYPLDRYPQPVIAATRALSDQATCAIGYQAPQLAAHAPTYSYEFADPAPPAPPSTFPLGAYHASELSYLWQMSPALGDPATMTPAQRRLSDELVRYWTRFVLTGTPDPAGLPAMPAHTGTNPNLMSFKPDTTGPISASAFDTDHHCGFWRTVTAQP
ncbi:carboxylesterase type B [Nocardia tenerifensis]|uniref:Carboxylic ester hydrolase n=1 Tax=Nocardia tenerifensis TaxID=228006 RepID=A0A318JYP4_9NOCA|nr:carboxylesterase family protein [Nocardia tenerifensis]PXX63852.1 carboxylesterase type B [Nocardia tenerifensis]